MLCEECGRSSKTELPVATDGSRYCQIHMPDSINGWVTEINEVLADLDCPHADLEDILYLLKILMSWQTDETFVALYHQTANDVFKIDEIEALEDWIKLMENRFERIERDRLSRLPAPAAPVAKATKETGNRETGWPGNWW